MIKNFYGIKEKTMQAFDKKGKRQVVTLLGVSPLVIKRIKTLEKDGYPALQVGFKKQGKEVLREIRMPEVKGCKVGQKIEVGQVLKEEDKVVVRGVSRGKGFSGVIKRWGFKGGPRTHGQSDRERAPGSIGQGTDPGRVWKGKKMAGRMGRRTIFVKGLKVFKIDEEKQEIWLKGLVPGARGGVIEISKIKSHNKKS